MLLVPCLVCRRHASSTAPSCPFCGGDLAPLSSAPAPLAGRATRAAIMAGALVMVGCSPTNNIAPVYGGPAPEPEPEPELTSEPTPDPVPSIEPSASASAQPQAPVNAYGAPAPSP
jgi:hypothetical protein